MFDRLRQTVHYLTIIPVKFVQSGDVRKAKGDSAENPPSQGEGAGAEGEGEGGEGEEEGGRRR